MRKVLLGLIALVLVLAAAGAGVTYYSTQALNRQEAKDFQLAKSLVEKDQPQKALKIIQDYSEAMSSKPPKSLDWLLLAGEAFASMGDSPSLTLLWEKYPRITDDNEDVAFVVAKGLIGQRKLENYQALRDNWYPESENQHVWFALDVDSLLVEGKREDARSLLTSKEFEGEKDTGRLLRLALIEANDDLQKAWDILSEAAKKDPSNTEITSYRAQILEAIQRPALARMEYLRSIQKDPDNAALYDQLAEFFRRHGHYAQALETWKAALSMPHSDVAWLKLAFWSRMTYPTDIPENLSPPESGELTPLVQFIRSLPENKFWDERKFEEVPGYPNFLRTRQETLWLRLAQALKDNDEARAMELLDFNVFHRSTWNPTLQNALKQILAYRSDGILHIDEVAPQTSVLTAAQNEQGDDASTQRHQFFTRLEKAAQSSPVGVPSKDIPEDLQAVLTSPQAFPAAFLAAGWLEAALTFPVPSVLPSEFPDWVAFAYTQGLRFTQGPLKALQFATRQKTSPALDLLIGELMIATGSPEAGIDYLQPLSKEDTELGMRAAWVISMLQMQNKDYKEARATVEAHPGLVKNIVGKEALARIALQQGDIVRADVLYEKISDESLEAKLYLARRAYANKKYDKALALTEQLILHFPENPDLRKDLEKLRNLVKSKDSQ